ncbi:ribonuclease Y [bacterium]|nr:ribonuclease Y [bacterium]
MYWIIVIIGVIFGGILGYLIRQEISRHQVDTAEAKAKEIITKAKVKQQEIFFKANEEALSIIEEAKAEEKKRRQELQTLADKLDQRQSLFEKKLLKLDEDKEKIEKEKEKIEKAKEKIKALYEEAKKKLEEVAGLSAEEAKQELFKKIEQEQEREILDRIRKLEKQGAEQIEKKAKQLITEVVERCSSSHVADITTSSVSLPSDEIKGRIIGREGRNIRALEAATGAEIIVDDTPLAVFVSAFSPLRRELAKRTLEKLILDGRIQPARIERVVESVKQELSAEIKKAGEEAVYNLGIVGLDPKLVQLIGRLKFRTSYGQNVLVHSIEVANLAYLLAQELGADANVCKKAGLLHDIGKALDQEVEGTHPEIGKEIAEKYNLPEEIIVPIATHHQDKPPTLEAVIVKVADAISGARPGARRESYEEYLKRLDELEKIASSFEGVEKSYAIEAGRELRVFVKPEEISDLQALEVAKKIAKRIEEDLTYPGEIRVTVIRENRIIEYAR